jgi:UDP-glucose-4-epimerase GalE
MPPAHPTAKRGGPPLLVTGGAGFVGAHFVHAAALAGRRVIVLDDLSGGDPLPLPEHVELVRGDVGDRPLVKQLLAQVGARGIVHFAGKIQVGESVQKPGLYFDVNLVRTLALLEAAREAGVNTFVFSSTAAVYGAPETVPITEAARLAPVNAYGASKLAIEYALDAYGVAHGLRWAALRYFNAAGAHPSGRLRECHQPETHLIPLVIDAALGRGRRLEVFGDDYPTPDGTCVRDYIHVVDLVEAHLLALDHLEAGTQIGAANLGSGVGFTVRQIIDEAQKVLGAPVPFDLAPRRPGDPPVLLADPTRAKQLLGWTPQRSAVDQILADAVRSRR